VKAVEIEFFTRGKQMKIFKKNIAGFSNLTSRFMGIILVAIVMSTSMAISIPILNLRSTENFVILAGSTVTVIPPAMITGDVGLSPAAGSYITGFDGSDVAGILYVVDASGPAGSVINSTLLTTAKGDITIAYNDAAGRTPIPTGPFLNPGNGNIGGLTLVGGLYKFTSSAAITGSDVTLTGNPSDVWIFQITSSLNVGSGIKVILSGGAQASNIFWQVGSSATMGSYSVMKGTILADQSISFSTGAKIDGRALAFTGAVTMGSSVTTTKPVLTQPVQLINLIGGWNLISSFARPSYPNMNDVWSELINDVVVVKNNTGKVFIPKYEINEIGNWDVTQGYKVYIPKYKTLKIYGNKVNPLVTPIHLYSGWNMLAYLRTNAMDCETALARITDNGNLKVMKNNAGAVYIPQYNINNIGNMIPGQGYMMYVTNSDNLIYPANPLSKNSSNFQNSKPQCLIIGFDNTGNNASALVRIEGSSNFDELGIYNQRSQLIGSGVIQNEIATITIWGNDIENDMQDAGDEGELLEMRYFNIIKQRFEDITIQNVKNLVVGNNEEFTYRKDIVYEIFGKMNVNSSISEMKVQPNPFYDATKIEFFNINECKGKIELFNTNGAKIRTIYEGIMKAGNQSFDLNANQLPSGEYNLIINLSGKSYLEKIVIAK